MKPCLVSQPPAGTVWPAPLPLVTLRAVALWQSRLRCGACHGRICVDRPTMDRGRLACLNCSRVYAEVVDEMPFRMTAEAWRAIEPVQPRRGRPPSPRVPCRDGVCGRPGPQGGPCSTCRTRQVRAGMSS